MRDDSIGGRQRTGGQGRVHRLIKRVLETYYRPLVLRYIGKDRSYRYRGIGLIVRRGVFHPGLFFSTKLMFDFLERLDLRSRSFLELGAGTGLLSIRAAQRGARVVAVDISPAAVENVRENARRNGVDVEVVESDLFSGVEARRFDVIVVTPPYYPREPRSEADYAWYCGENFEYFERLFSQLGGFAARDSTTLMILSEDCRRDTIFGLASRHGFEAELVREKRVLWERNFIYRLRRREASAA